MKEYGYILHGMNYVDCEKISFYINSKDVDEDDIENLVKEKVMMLNSQPEINFVPIHFAKLLRVYDSNGNIV